MTMNMNTTNNDATTAAVVSASNGGIVPTDLDILCGKTKRIVNHPGTIRYQQILDSYTERYMQADTKFDKMTVTKTLYEQLKSTSRFLKFNEKEQVWEEISSLAARDKIGHALRFAVKVVKNNSNNNANGTNDDDDNNNASTKKPAGKKRSKGRRRANHRRVGSDFSAASISSIFSDVSTNTTATAASDGGEAVKSLVLTLNTTFTINEPPPQAVSVPPVPAVQTTATVTCPPTSIPPPASLLLPTEVVGRAVEAATTTIANSLTGSSPLVPPKRVFSIGSLTKLDDDVNNNNNNNHHPLLSDHHMIQNVEIPSASIPAAATAPAEHKNDPFLLWLQDNNNNSGSNNNSNSNLVVDSDGIGHGINPRNSELSLSGIQIIAKLEQSNPLENSCNRNFNYNDKKDNNHHQPLMMAQQQQLQHHHRQNWQETPSHELSQVSPNADFDSAMLHCEPHQHQPVAVPPAPLAAPSLDDEKLERNASSTNLPLLEITIPEGECYHHDNDNDNGNNNVKRDIEVDKMSQDFLSMLRDPIYDLDADDF